MSAEEHAERDMPDSVRELTDTLRELRTRSGLTLAALAQRTDVSKSSWERYLNGKKFPPRTAVVAFARAVGVKPDRLLLLWDLAARARHRTAKRELPGQAAESAEEQGGGGSAPGGTSDASGHPEGARAEGGAPRDPLSPFGSTSDMGGKRSGAFSKALRTRRAAVIGVVACGLLLGSFTLLRGGDDGGSSSNVAESGPGKCMGFECQGKDARKQQCDLGAWTAGLSEMSGSWVELRYSPSCRAAWARITLAKIGDSARVVNVVNEASEERAISFDSDVYSPMVDAPFPGAVRACGVKPQAKGKPEIHCTDPGASTPVEWPTTPPSTGPDPRDDEKDADDGKDGKDGKDDQASANDSADGQDAQSPEGADQESARRAENEPTLQVS